MAIKQYCSKISPLFALFKALFHWWPMCGPIVASHGVHRIRAKHSYSTMHGILVHNLLHLDLLVLKRGNREMLTMMVFNLWHTNRALIK